MTEIADVELENDIVITREEANSQHVDDLLKRQMSLRGETGVTAEPARRWYYQNWILFMIVGAISATIAWAVIEPFFDDYHYLQGKIEALDLEPVLGEGTPASGGDSELYAQGWVKVRGEQVWLSPDVRRYSGGHATDLLAVEKLHPGQEVGVFTKVFESPRGITAIAPFVDDAPKGPASGKAILPLREQNNRSDTAGFLLFSIVASIVGLGIGAADGVVCRLPRRAIMGGLIGALVGFVGGLLSGVIGNVIYIPLARIASDELSAPTETARALGFLLQMIARMFAWTLTGSAVGLGQGIALRSKRLLSYGLLGGMMGGLLGGLLFDPIDLVILGSDRPGAEVSRFIGLLVIGAAVGAMIGVVELLTRDAWLRMTEGPLAGKEFLIFRDVMDIGASPRSEIYLFNDTKVAPTHATLRTVGDQVEITARDRIHPLLVNGHSSKTARLRHGDRITIGATSFIFEQRQR